MQRNEQIDFFLSDKTLELAEALFGIPLVMGPNDLARIAALAPLAVSSVVQVLLPELVAVNHGSVCTHEEGTTEGDGRADTQRLIGVAITVSVAPAAVPGVGVALCCWPAGVVVGAGSSACVGVARLPAKATESAKVVSGAVEL